MRYGFLGNLYWTDPKLKVIEVCRLDGSNRYVVLPRGIDSPHSLALDPPHGYLFWTDIGKHPRISRAGLDASNSLVIANLTSGTINDITLDYVVSKHNVVYQYSILVKKNYFDKFTKVLLM